jgi:hypothetical protein
MNWTFGPGELKQNGDDKTSHYKFKVLTNVQSKTKLTGFTLMAIIYIIKYIFYLDQENI